MKHDGLDGLRQAESQETFDASFSYAGMSGGQCMETANVLIAGCQRQAAELAKEWLLKHGYFNGEMRSTVYDYPAVNTVNVQVVLSCYGLPNRTLKEQP